MRRIGSMLVDQYSFHIFYTELAVRRDSDRNLRIFLQKGSVTRRFAQKSPNFVEKSPKMEPS
jgi:hypothetical protein